FRRQQPEKPIVLALTGTDLYQAIKTDPIARQALELVTRLVVLQPLGVNELPSHLRERTRVIYQSWEAPGRGNSNRTRKTIIPGNSRSSIHDAHTFFDVCVLGHLRPVKDPFRTAGAARLLPASSQIRVLHAGAALSHEMEEQARAEQA